FEVLQAEGSVAPPNGLVDRLKRVALERSSLNVVCALDVSQPALQLGPEERVSVPPVRHGHAVHSEPFGSLPIVQAVDHELDRPVLDDAESPPTSLRPFRRDLLGLVGLDPSPCLRHCAPPSAVRPSCTEVPGSCPCPP